MRRASVRAGRVGAIVLGVGVGALSESVAFGWDEPLLWLPDLVVGLTWIACGVAVWPRSRGIGGLAAAVGFAWFVGGLLPVALYWHRGVLVHLLVTFPGWRPRGRLAVAGVVAGYGVAAAPALWRDEITSVVLAVALLGFAVGQRVAPSGRGRRERPVVLRAVAALSAVLVAGALARLVVPAGAAAIPSLLAYEAVLCGIAVALTLDVMRARSPVVTDLVVELGETSAEPLRDALAEVLGDPALRIGIWAPSRGEHVDHEGATVAAGGPDQVATRIERDGRPFAVLVHDAAVLGDPSLVAAVAAATRLTAANTALQADVRAKVDALTASRRRLIVAADRERELLEERLRHGAERRLVRLLDEVRGQPPGSGDEHLAAAVSHLERTLDDLHQLARGLHPRELAGGLAPALAQLADGGPIPVRLAVGDARYAPELEAAVYYVCAEAVANAVKHARAGNLSIAVSEVEDRLTVAVVDDGVGGADPAKGRGLAGIADRIAALGGRLRVTSAPGAGTRLDAETPLLSRSSGTVSSRTSRS